MKGIIFLALMLSFSFISTTLAQEQDPDQAFDEAMAGLDEEIGFPGLTRCNARLANLLADGAKADILELVLDICGIFCMDGINCLAGPYPKPPF